MSKFSEAFKSFFVKKNSQEKALLTKQAIAIIVCIALFAVGIGTYFIWAKPAEESSGKPDYLYDGEAFVDSSSILMMFRQYTRNDIESIEILNKSGNYKLVANIDKGYVKYLDGDTVIYVKDSSLTDIIGDTGHTLTKNSGYASYLVKADVSAEKLSEYGLDISQGTKINYSDGEKNHVFLLGSKKELENGYNYYVLYNPDAETDAYAVYSLIALTTSTQFKLEGFETTSLDSNSVSAVVIASTVVSTIAPSTKEFRVTENAAYEDLRQYGLDDESSPSSVLVTLVDGSSYKLIIGGKIPSGGGYYTLADGRMNDGKYIVYIIGSNAANTLLCGSEALLDTLVLPSLGNDAASITDFRLYRSADATSARELIVRAGLASEANKTADTTTYTMIYPTAYTLDEDTYYDKVISSLAYIYATGVKSFGERIHTEEIYSKFGLDLDTARLADGTDKNHAKIMFTAVENPTDDDYSVLYFSEKMKSADGLEFFYVYSPLYEAIYAVSSDSFEFIDYSLAKFTRGNLYFNYLNCTDYFELVSKRLDASVRYTLSGDEKSYKAVITEAGDNGAPLTRTDSTGKTVEGELHVEYTIKTIGTYTTTDYHGDFENFRSLFYVLITRALSLENDSVGHIMSETPAYTVRIAESPNDQPMSYTRYDTSGNKVYYTDENGYQRLAQVRYAGGSIICGNVVVTSSDGSQLKYSTAYYDESVGKFFLKVKSTNDGNLKPANYKYDAENNLVVSTYLPQNTTGEYTQKIYEHNIYDIYNVYTDASGKTVKQINQTYKYSVPTTTVRTFRIETDGTKTLLSEVTETAQAGVLIRTQIVEKLFSDSDKLISGIEIDRESVN